MESDITVRCCRECPVEDVQGYCDTCKSPFCKKCMGNHIGHTTEKLKDFCRQKKKEVLNQISVRELSVQLEEKRKDVITKGKRLKVDGDNTKRLIKEKEEASKNAEQNYSQEIERMEAVTRYLIGLEDEASTYTLKNACEEAMKLFDLEDKIKKSLIL